MQRVALLKIDVEGAELDVLRGVDPLDWPRIQQVSMELESAAHAAEASELLSAVGFTVHTWINPELAAILPTCQVHQLLAKRVSHRRREAEGEAGGIGGVGYDSYEDVDDAGAIVPPVSAPAGRAAASRRRAGDVGAPADRSNGGGGGRRASRSPARRARY